MLDAYFCRVLKGLMLIFLVLDFRHVTADMSVRFQHDFIKTFNEISIVRRHLKFV